LAARPTEESLKILVESGFAQPKAGSAR